MTTALSSPGESVGESSDVVSAAAPTAAAAAFDESTLLRLYRIRFNALVGVAVLRALVCRASCVVRRASGEGVGVIASLRAASLFDGLWRRRRQPSSMRHNATRGSVVRGWVAIVAVVVVVVVVVVAERRWARRSFRIVHETTLMSTPFTITGAQVRRRVAVWRA